MSVDSSRPRSAATALSISSLFAVAALLGCGGGGSVDGSTEASVSGADPGRTATVQTSHNATPVRTCDAAGIGSVQLVSDLPTLPTTTPPNDTSVTITSVSTGTTPSGAPYCLVRVLVAPAINIWVALPTEGRWNGRLQSEGGGGYAGSVNVPNNAVSAGYVGIQTDTGHTGGSGTFGMLTPVPNGAPDVQLQSDFAFRSEHLMAVIGKQLTQAFYGQLPEYSYWNGCSTGGRQGMRMAQDFPGDYDGILAGAPAFHWDRFQAAQIWPQVVMRSETGGPIAAAKQTLASNAAVAACDASDGVADGVLEDPRTCAYNPANDPTITRSNCTSTDNTCLTPAEATAIQKIWSGPVNTQGKRLWYGLTRGTALGGLGGTNPFAISVAQPRYWVYFDPSWDWTTLTYGNYETFFKDTMRQVNPMMASENPDLRAFRDRGGKLLMWHGWSDQLIMPEGSIAYYDAVTNFLGGGYAQTRQFFRHFMAPGVAHCGGGTGPQPQNLFQSVVDWVEKGVAPETILASRNLPGGGTQTRPLCLYPNVARYVGSGSTDDAANFVCTAP
ncbi:MAG TPA: tannase/feruloyl esterase family alpha/beta hydrolase [Caldimonas sp.]|jgi:hypothetical protein|nr:tannase/feruloyl esterase family alpha/beta hydrolase [Caldimonas sp.]HEX2542440.1 tannase/feruloyl esterase family alpha/beta hydrolase [Caldimonas sp.]